MRTFLLTWNPGKWPWETLREDMERFRETGYHRERWSCGNRKDLPEGSRAFLMRLGGEPKGLVASGVVICEPYTDLHWDAEKGGRGEKATYVDVVFDVLSERPVIHLDELADEPLPPFNWTPQSSGRLIPERVADVLEEVWAERAQNGRQSLYPDELPGGEALVEGSVKTVTVNAYERNPEARRQCLEKNGTVCSVCEVDFGKRYGPVAQGFIHVHHVIPISEMRKGHVVDPEKDLVPVCPNCHAVIHKRKPPFRVDEVRQLIARAR